MKRCRGSRTASRVIKLAITMDLKPAQTVEELQTYVQQLIALLLEELDDGAA